MLPFDEGDAGDFLEHFSSRDMDELIDVFGSQENAYAIAEWFSDNWLPNEGGFEAGQILDMIYEVDNVEVWQDEDGVTHVSFDYEWESPDGQYHGSGHVSG